MTLLDEVRAIKLELAERYYGGCCYVCGKTKHRKGMVFHHKRYIPNDVIHSNYPKNSTGSLQYHKDLSIQIKSKPSRFLYLCSPHHQALERLLRYNKKTLTQLLRAVRMSG